MADDAERTARTRHQKTTRLRGGTTEEEKNGTEEKNGQVLFFHSVALYPVGPGPPLSDCHLPPVGKHTFCRLLPYLQGNQERPQTGRTKRMTASGFCPDA